MKKVMTILGALLVSSTCFAQQLKTYNGNYDLKSYEVDILGLNEGLFDGTANYTYYEDKEYRRILSGKFTYNGKLNENMSKAGKVDASLYVKGNYKNDKKNGKWYIKQSMKTNQGTASCVFNGSYKNGLPDGAWVISATLYNNSQTITANFNNNILNGEFKITASSNKGQTTTGTLDEDGYLTGSAQIIKNNIEIKAEYQRGLCTFFIKRDLQDGRIYEKYKIDPLELKIFNLLMDEKDTSITDTIPYKIIHDRYANYIGDDFIEAFKMGSLMDMFPGDASLDENNRFTWKGFDLRSLQKSESKKDLRIRLEKEKLEKDSLEKQNLEIRNQNIAIYNNFKIWYDNHKKIKEHRASTFFGTKAKLYNLYEEKNNSFDNMLTNYIKEITGQDEYGYTVRIPYYTFLSDQTNFSNIQYLFNEIQGLYDVRKITENGNSFSSEILKIMDQSENSLKILGKELKKAKSNEEKYKLLGLEKYL